jgi:hypothetical protein
LGADRVQKIRLSGSERGDVWLSWTTQKEESVIEAQLSRSKTRAQTP